MNCSFSKNLEESERKSEQKAIDDSKAAQLATSEAARASMAGEDPAAAAKDKEKKEAAQDAKGSAAVSGGVGLGSAGGMMNNYSEIRLATTDAARKANLMMGLGDDGTVIREIKEQSIKEEE